MADFYKFTSFNGKQINGGPHTVMTEVELVRYIFKVESTRKFLC